MNQTSYTLVARPPKFFGSDDIASFKELVRIGGEVNDQTLSSLVSGSLLLAFARRNETLVAIGAVKRPNDSYRTKIFLKAGVLERMADFEHELGWIYVDPAARGNGLSRKIVDVLLTAPTSGHLYATSRVNNLAMHTTLKHFGFTEAGAPYPSSLNEPQIQLFLRS